MSDADKLLAIRQLICDELQVPPTSETLRLMHLLLDILNGPES
jgi:hypothetical protein